MVYKERKKEEVVVISKQSYSVFSYFMYLCFIMRCLCAS